MKIKKQHNFKNVIKWFLLFVYFFPTLLITVPGLLAKQPDEECEVPSGLVCAACSEAPDNKIIYASVNKEEVVVMSGLLNLIYFYDVPGFGESPQTDSIQGAYILSLHQPIDYEEISQENYEPYHIKTCLVHLSDTKGLIKKEHMVGKNVRIKTSSKAGMWGSITGHHRAPVVASILEIQLLKP